MAFDADNTVSLPKSPAKMVGNDTAEVTRLKDELKQAKADLRLILDHMPARIWYKDSHNKIIRLNDEAAQSMGISIEKAEGADTYDLFPEMAKKYHDDDLSVINSGIAQKGIIEEYMPLNGECGWVKTDKIPLTDPETGEKYVLVVSTDISEQKLNEDKLRENEARLEEVLNACYDGYWDRNFKTGSEYMSSRFLQSLGFDPDEIRNHSFNLRDYVVETDEEAGKELGLNHFNTRGKVPFVQEIGFRRSDGTVLTTLCRGQVIEWDADDAPVRMVGTLTDLTQLKASQQAVIEMTERFEIAAKGASVGIWDYILDKTKDDWWSPVYYQLLGYENKEITASYETTESLMHPDDTSVATQALANHLEKQEPFSIEARIRHKAQGYRWYLTSGQAQWDSQGKPIRMLGSLMDIHERKMASIAIVDYTARLEQANRDLDHFAYVASHDLKAPLRGMDNLAQWIAEDMGAALTPDIEQKLGMLRGRVNRMEALLKDILAFSRAGKNMATAEDIDISDMIDEISGWLSPLGGFEIIKDTALPMLKAPRTPVEHIWLNLLSNAIKHHDKTEGTVRVGCIDTPKAYEFYVADDGPGIAAQYQDHVFQIFKKLKRRDEVEGSGIGLAIVKKMVETLGGTIWISSEDGKRGTTFHFTIPKPLKTKDSS